MDHPEEISKIAAVQKKVGWEVWAGGQGGGNLLVLQVCARSQRG